MTTELVILLGEAEAGRLRRERHGRVALTYAPTWREDPRAYPLSLSMPLAVEEHRHAVVEPFLWGLLPDSDAVLERWSSRFGVSSRNVFALLTHVGEDCAGAVRFALPERAEDLTRQSDGAIEWLDDADVAARLRLLRTDAAAWRAAGDTGQFSLAGAQPKTALLRRKGRWGVPSGRTPTTHILKPGIRGLDAQAENEHFCLALAQAAGIPTASSAVERFEDEIAIVVERYDRTTQGSAIVRVHQEDACQALGIHPAKKYEVDGGPGVASIARILRDHSRKPDVDLDTFVEALAFNWLIGGTDAHAKNYSFLLGLEGRVRLAPLYDVASALPYDHLQLRKLRLAMRIGGKYRIWELGRHEWTKLAGEIGREPESVVERVHALAVRLPNLAADLTERVIAAGLEPKAMRRLDAEVRASAKRFGARLALSSSAR